MVIAGSPAEVAALDDFRAYLEEIIAGVSAEVPDNSAPVSCSDAEPAPRRPGRASYQPTIREMPAQERPRERLR